MPDITQQRLEEIHDLLIETEIKRMEAENKFTVLCGAINLITAQAIEVGKYVDALQKMIEGGTPKLEVLAALATIDDFWQRLASQHIVIAEASKLALQLYQGGTDTQLT